MNIKAGDRVSWMDGHNYPSQRYGTVIKIYGSASNAVVVKEVDD